MIRKIILFGLIVASCVPAGIKAAAEPIRTQPRKPYILIMSGKARDAQFTGWLQNLVGPGIDVRENNLSSGRKISAADIANAACVLYSIDTYRRSYINFAIFKSMFPYFQDANGEGGLMRGFFGNPNRAIVMCNPGSDQCGVSESLDNFFDQNIFKFYQNGQLIVSASPTSCKWIQNIARTQEEEFYFARQRAHTSPGIDDTKQREQQLHKEPSAQTIEGSKTLDEMFQFLDDEAIAAQLQEYITQEKRGLIDHLFELISKRFTQPEDSQHIDHIRNLMPPPRPQSRLATSIISLRLLNMFTALRNVQAADETVTKKQLTPKTPMNEETCEQQQQLHREPSARAIAMSKEALEDAFPVFDDETIIEHLISYMVQENAAMVDTMIELLKERYTEQADSLSINAIYSAVANKVPRNNRLYVGTQAKIEQLFNTVYSKKQ